MPHRSNIERERILAGGIALLLAADLLVAAVIPGALVVLLAAGIGISFVVNEMD
jgi:hypothetical protein